MKEKIIERIKDIYSKLIPLSNEVEADFNNAKSDDIAIKMQLVSKSETLKSYYNQFFLLCKILIEDCETPLSEVSTEISDHFTIFNAMLDKIKTPQAQLELQKILNKKNG